MSRRRAKQGISRLERILSRFRGSRSGSRHITTEQHWQVASDPFADEPDSDFFYPSRDHDEAVTRMIFATERRYAFALLTAERGMGKSICCQALRNQLAANASLHVAYMALDPGSGAKTLGALAQQLGAKPPPADLADAVAALRRLIDDHAAAGRHTVVILDDCQNATETLLDDLRLLVSPDDGASTRITFILAGDDSFRKTLEKMPQIRGRIVLAFALSRLSAEDVAEYITHRLQLVGGRASIFTPNCMAEVARRTGGVPRAINRLCHRSMSHCATTKRQSIGVAELLDAPVGAPRNDVAAAEADTLEAPVPRELRPEPTVAPPSATPAEPSLEATVAPEPAPEPEPESAPVTAPEPALEPETAAQPAPEPVPEPEPESVAAPAPEPIVVAEPEPEALAHPEPPAPPPAPPIQPPEPIAQPAPSEPEPAPELAAPSAAPPSPEPEAVPEPPEPPPCPSTPEAPPEPAPEAAPAPPPEPAPEPAPESPVVAPVVAPVADIQRGGSAATVLLITDDDDERQLIGRRAAKFAVDVIERERLPDANGSDVTAATLLILCVRDDPRGDDALDGLCAAAGRGQCPPTLVLADNHRVAGVRDRLAAVDCDIVDRTNLDLAEIKRVLARRLPS